MRKLIRASERAGYFLRHARRMNSGSGNGNDVAILLAHNRYPEAARRLERFYKPEEMDLRALQLAMTTYGHLRKPSMVSMYAQEAAKRNEADGEIASQMLMSYCYADELHSAESFLLTWLTNYSNNVTERQDKALQSYFTNIRRRLHSKSSESIGGVFENQHKLFGSAVPWSVWTHMVRMYWLRGAWQQCWMIYKIFRASFQGAPTSEKVMTVGLADRDAYRCALIYIIRALYESQQYVRAHKMIAEALHGDLLKSSTSDSVPSSAGSESGFDTGAFIVLNHSLSAAIHGMVHVQDARLNAEGVVYKKVDSNDNWDKLVHLTKQLCVLNASLHTAAPDSLGLQDIGVAALKESVRSLVASIVITMCQTGRVETAFRLVCALEGASSGVGAGAGVERSGDAAEPAAPKSTSLLLPCMLPPIIEGLAKNGLSQSAMVVYERLLKILKNSPNSEAPTKPTSGGATDETLMMLPYQPYALDVEARTAQHMKAAAYSDVCESLFANGDMNDLTDFMTEHNSR
jgi:hypothetical protein